MQIQKVGFRYYSSIGDQAVELNFAQRINLLIGPNNAGKSNTISALVRLFERKANWRQTVELELHKRGAENPPMLNIEGSSSAPFKNGNGFLPYENSARTTASGNVKSTNRLVK